jgi:iron complex outermembrane recepter protein
MINPPRAAGDWSRALHHLSQITVALIGVALLVPVATAQAGATGLIAGQVSNKSTGRNLAQAQIHVVESNRDYYSEPDGTFEIGPLAVGEYTLVVDYPALDSTSLRVSVEAGRTVRTNVALNSDVYVLPELVVAGQREGNAAAIVEQRQAANVKNVITADAFGDITKANLANILKRIPGVTGITDDEIDTSVIMVRGMEAYLTSVDIDGTRAPSAFNGSRRQNVNAIPADIIDKIEVVKATTADEDADSLGGRVKLTTKSAFDFKGRRLDLRLGGSYNMTYGKHVTPDGKDFVPPSALLTYSDVVDFMGRPESLGILFTTNYDRFRDARSNTDFPWVNAANKTPKVGEKDYTVFRNTSAELHDQVRKGASLRLDYRFADHTVLGLRTTFTRYVDDLVRSRDEFAAGTVDPALSDSDPYVTFVNNATYEAEKYLRLSTTDTVNIRANGVTTFGSSKLSYDAVFTQAAKFEFRNNGDFVSNRKFSYTMDRGADKMYPHLTIRAGADPFTDDFSDTASTSLEARRQAVDSEIWASHLDYSRDVEWKLPLKLQTGLRYRSEFRVEDQDRFVAAVAPAVGKNLSGYTDPNWHNGGAVNRYPAGAIPGFDRLLGSNVNFVGGPDPRTAWTYDPNVIAVNASSTVQQSLLNDRKIGEDVTAGYVQGTAKAGRLTVVAGTRFERTDLSAIAPVRNRSVTDVLAQFSGRSRSTASYNDWFPSVHATYQPMANVKARASYSTTIGRPDVDTLLANADINLSSRSITVGNSGLKPQYSDNYDLSLEYYFKPVGVLSVGVFQKNIRDYISSPTLTITAPDAAQLGAPLTNPSVNDPSWALTTSINSGDAKVRGLEFNYSQQLSFLPGAFRGLGVFLNYTWIQSEGQRQAGGTTPLQNFVPRSGSTGLSYTYGRFDARVQLGFNSAFLDNLDSSSRWRDQYKGERYQLDFNGRCQLTRKVAVFVNLSNITSQSYAELRGNTDPIRREGTTGYSYIATAGVTVSFF